MKIDWSKPVQYTANFPGAKPQPVRVIGKDGDNIVVRVNEGAYYLINIHGQFVGLGSTHQYFSNIPEPPKVVKAFLVMTRRGRANIVTHDPRLDKDWEQGILAVREVSITEGEGV